MRSILILFALLASITSLASTTLEFVCGTYTIKATLTSDSKIPAKGTVVTDGENGRCTGNFELDLYRGTLTVTLDGLGGPGTPGGCNNESATIEIDHKQYTQLVVERKILELKFRSKKFYNEPKLAMVKVISPSSSYHLQGWRYQRLFSPPAQLRVKGAA
jgi:hypothetical protein